MRIRSLTALVGAAALCGALGHAQYQGTAQARVAFDRGKEELRSDKVDAALADLWNAVTIDPNFTEAQEEYISRYVQKPFLLLRLRTSQENRAMTSQELARATAEQEEQRRNLVKRYEALAGAHRKDAVYEWALAKIYEESDIPRQEEYCRRAIEIDDRFAPGFGCLSTVAYDRGDQKDAIAYQKRVVELEPDNAEAFFAYSFYLSGEPVAYRSAIDQMIAKFPQAKESAQALDWYAIHQKNDAAEIQWLEKLRSQYSPAKYDWSWFGAYDLFMLYDRTEPAKARALADEMHALLPKDDDWTALASYANATNAAENMLSSRPADAFAALKAIQPPEKRFDMGRVQLLEAHVLELQGKTAEAYSLLISSYAAQPTDEMRSAIGRVAAKLGKSPANEASDIWTAISGNAKPAIPFALPGFTDAKQVTLESYRGHVVIVDFWFPLCGPCRQAFPYLQQVLSKYKDRGVVVLAINVDKDQESEVIPFLKNKGYAFIPLKGTHEWALSQYHVQSYPTTFLIGSDGRAYFRPRTDDRYEERTTELEIEELLKHHG